MYGWLLDDGQWYFLVEGYMIKNTAFSPGFTLKQRTKQLGYLMNPVIFYMADGIGMDMK